MMFILKKKWISRKWFWFQIKVTHFLKFFFFLILKNIDRNCSGRTRWCKYSDRIEMLLPWVQWIATVGREKIEGQFICSIRDGTAIKATKDRLTKQHSRYFWNNKNKMNLFTHKKMTHWEIVLHFSCISVIRDFSFSNETNKLLLFRVF